MTLLYLLVGFGVCFCLGYFVSTKKLESSVGNIVSVLTTLGIPILTVMAKQKALEEQVNAGFSPGSAEPTPSAATHLPNGWVMFAVCLVGLVAGGWQRSVARRKLGLPEDGD